MKFLKRIFPKVVKGLTEIELLKLRNEIAREYYSAKSRQKNPDAGPNQYMVGLSKAITIIDKAQVHDIGEVI